MMQDFSGQQIDRYELRERLGRGGMAEVYKAYHLPMDRFVALKIMLPHLTEDATFLERFKREAQSVGKLRHPHILQVFDFGSTDSGVHYMVMEYIAGDNLKAVIQKHGRMSTVHALTIARQLADALTYAHERNMIHRDLKPANVMFTDNDHQHAILTDFGIAKILTQTGLTESGMSIGTPAYMSPEAGLGENTDHRADIYALGVMLYEMLVGHAPYDADTPLAVLMKHVHAPLPTRSDYGEFVPEVAEGIVLKAMAKSPDDRYQSAAAMRDALDAALEKLDSGEALPPTATPPPPPKPPIVENNTTRIAPEASPTQATPPEAKPNRTGVIIGVAVVVLLLLAGLGWFFFGASHNEDVPIETGTLLPLPDLTLDGQMPPDPAHNLDMTLSPLSATLAQIDAAYLSQQYPDLETLEALIPDDADPLDALFTRAMLRNNYYDMGALDIAEELIDTAPDDIRGYIAASDVYLTYPAYDTDMSRTMIERAAEIDPEHPEVMWRLSRLANWEDEDRLFNTAEANGAGGYRFIQHAAYSQYYNGHESRAIPYLERLLQVQNDDVATYEARTALMGALMLNGQNDEAYALAELMEDEEAFAPRYADSAFVAYWNEDNEQAEAWAKTALALDSQQHDATWILALLAWEQDNDSDTALEMLVSLNDLEFYPNYLDLRFDHSLYLDQARILREIGEPDAALELYQKQLDINESANLYIERAELYIDMENWQSAVDDLNRALGYIEDSDWRQDVLDMLVEVNENL